ncbi:tetratricopeptide repeat protein [Streptosporangium sp. NPDC023963]|uniref:tetratricopeptide repeat protein n=1 Tax=Streptosporangium sp. NPDC023963 TaxID=3155608 RepID=UPI00341866E6
MTELCRERGVTFSAGAFASLWNMAINESKPPPPAARPEDEGGASPAVTRRAPSLAPPLGRLPARVHGRDELVEELCGLLTAPDGRAHIVAGMGGSGKTTVALAVAAFAVRAGMRVWWVPADDSSLLDDMLQITFELGATAAEVDDARSGRRSGADLFWSYLNRRREPARLLVIDGADNPESLAAGRFTAADGTGWVRGGDVGLVIVTSRMRAGSAWGRHARCHEIGPLDERSGAALLLDLAPAAGSLSSAHSLTTRLGHLPLALFLAGRHLSSPFAANRDFDGYMKTLESDVTVLDEQPVPTDSGIVQTWEMSLDELERQGHAKARVLLHLLAHYSPDTPLPISVVELVTRSRDDLPANGGRLRRTLQALHDMGLVEVRPEPPEYGGGLTLHPLVAEVSRFHAGAATAEHTTAAAVTVLALALDHWDLEHNRHWPLLDILGSHARTLLHKLLPSVEEGVLTAGVAVGAELGRLLLASGRVHAAAELVSTATELATGLGAAHPASLFARARTAQVRRAQARFAEAREILDELLEVKLRALGPHHEETLTVRLCRAAVLWESATAATGENEYLTMLVSNERLFGPGHPTVEAVRANLALAKSDQVLLARAEDEIQTVLEAWTTQLGPEHPETLSARSDLAQVLLRQGKVDIATSEFRSVAEAYRAAVGPHHPRALSAAHDVAVALRATRVLPAAESALRTVLTGRRRVLGEDHPETLATWAHLAGVLRDQQCLVDAEAEFAALLRVRRDSLGEDHRDTVTTLADHAGVLWVLGRHEKAAEELREAWRWRLGVLGDRHPDTLIARADLARVLAAGGHLSEAEEEYASLAPVVAASVAAGHAFLAAIERERRLVSAARVRSEPSEDPAGRPESAR